MQWPLESVKTDQNPLTPTYSVRWLSQPLRCFWKRLTLCRGGLYLAYKIAPNCTHKTTWVNKIDRGQSAQNHAGRQDQTYETMKHKLACCRWQWELLIHTKTSPETSSQAKILCRFHFLILQWSIFAARHRNKRQIMGLLFVRWLTSQKHATWYIRPKIPGR